MKIKLWSKAFVILLLLASTLLQSRSFGSETWRLGAENNTWQQLSQSEDDQLAQDIAKLKQLVTDGSKSVLDNTIDSFKAQHPSITGEDFDAYMEGEKLFAQKKWTKAVRAYDDFLNRFPHSTFYDAAIERQLSIAIAYLNGEKRTALWVLKLSGFDDGVKVAHGIADRLGDTDTALRALIEVANAYANKKEYVEAYETWTEISSRWATGEVGERALIERAYMQHSAYNGANYDSTGLTSALSFYEKYKSIHPELAFTKNVDQKVHYADEQLAHKEFNIAEYYSRTDKPKAAKMYYNYVVEKWPDSAAAKAATARLNENSVTVIEVDNPNIKFHTPESFKKAGRKMFNAGDKFLESWPDMEKGLDKYILREKPE